GVGAGLPGDDEDAVDDGELEPVFVGGDAGERCALGLAERGEDIDAAGEAGLPAHEGGKAAPDGMVGGVDQDEVCRLKHIGGADLVFFHVLWWFMGLERVGNCDAKASYSYSYSYSCSPPIPEE